MVKVQNSASYIKNHFKAPKKCQMDNSMEDYNVLLNTQSFGDTNYKSPRSKKKRTKRTKKIQKGIIVEIENKRKGINEMINESSREKLFDDFTHCPNINEMNVPALRF